MEFLRALESVRTPFFDEVFSILTYLGDQTVFMIAVLAVLWCINKKWGYRLFFIGITGSIFNQLLKAIFLVPRPWVIDESFAIVESARDAATGYSFPSGHTQSAATLFGGIGAWLQKRWAWLICAALVVLTAFSRMYLGVHTPADVLVSLATGAATVAVLAPLFIRFDGNRRAAMIIGGAGVLFALVLLAYVQLAPKTSANVAEFDEHGLKNAATLLGTMAGLCVAWFVDSKYIRYETQAALWAQFLKISIGLGLIIGVRVGLKPVLSAIMGETVVGDGLRYFIMTVMGGVVWPLTFKWWASLGGRKSAAREE